MQPGNPADPLLRQVLPLAEELAEVVRENEADLVIFIDASVEGEPGAVRQRRPVPSASVCLVECPPARPRITSTAMTTWS